MLNTNDLLLINQGITIKDVSLSLYKDFFDSILCKRIFIYELADGKTIKLMFQETHLMHILGAQHILGDKYKAKKFNDQIISKNMSFEVLETQNNKAFNDYVDRFVNFSNLYYVLSNCSLVYFDKEIYNKNARGEKVSLMDFTHILYKDINTTKVHAGISTFNKGNSYFCKSLLVTSVKNEKLIKDQDPVSIEKITIIDKTTNKILFTKLITTNDTSLLVAVEKDS